MKRILARYADTMDRVSVFIGHGCATVIFACIAVSAFEVVMRYGFDRPTIWSTELAMTLCAAAWVLSVGSVSERGRHISITMLQIMVGPRTWRIFRLVQMLVSAGAIFVLTLALWDPAVRAVDRVEHTGTALNSIQPVILKTGLVLGCILYLLQLAANVIRWVQKTEGPLVDGH